LASGLRGIPTGPEHCKQTARAARNLLCRKRGTPLAQGTGVSPCGAPPRGLPCRPRAAAHRASARPGTGQRRRRPQALAGEKSQNSPVHPEAALHLGPRPLHRDLRGLRTPGAKPPPRHVIPLKSTKGNRQPRFARTRAARRRPKERAGSCAAPLKATAPHVLEKRVLRPTRETHSSAPGEGTRPPLVACK
jgi:hypothetical protein